MVIHEVGLRQLVKERRLPNSTTKHLVSLLRNFKTEILPPNDMFMEQLDMTKTEYFLWCQDFYEMAHKGSLPLPKDHIQAIADSSSLVFMKQLDDLKKTAYEVTSFTSPMAPIGPFALYSGEISFIPTKNIGKSGMGVELKYYHAFDGKRSYNLSEFNNHGRIEIAQDLVNATNSFIEQLCYDNKIRKP